MASGDETVTHTLVPIKKKKKTQPYHVAPYGYLTFQGKGPNRQDSFSVLCGDNPPKITDGYAIWGPVQRPLLRAVTVFQGYNPAQMTVEVRFGKWTDSGWQTDDDAGRAIEQDIERLEWMAGANFVAGPSPYVYVNSYGPLGGTTPLVPPNYQQTASVRVLADHRTWPWVISGGIQWGESWRNRSGYRTRQDATVVLTNYQGFTPPPQKSTSGGYFVARPGRDTPLLIAEAPSSHALFPEALAKRIVDDAKNRDLRLRSIKQKIRHGKRCWVPAHQT